MEKEVFLRRLWAQKEDRYTDFWYINWEGRDENKNWFYDILVGDVTQIEQGEDIVQEDGFRKEASKIKVVTRDGNSVYQSYGFVASINKTPVVRKKRWDSNGIIEGEDNNMMLHKDKIYKDNDVVFIDVYPTRDLAFKAMIDKFWEYHSKFLCTVR